MSLEADIVTKFAALFTGNNLYWDSLPQDFRPEDHVSPFCICNMVPGGALRIYLDNTRHEMQKARVQFAVWGNRRIDVSDKMDQLVSAILAENNAEFVTEFFGAPSGDFNDVLRLHGSLLDVGIWWKNPLVTPA